MDLGGRFATVQTAWRSWIWLVDAGERARPRALTFVGVLALLVVTLSSLAFGYATYEWNRRNWTDQLLGTAQLMAVHTQAALAAAEVSLDAQARGVDGQPYADGAAFETWVRSFPVRARPQPLTDSLPQPLAPLAVASDGRWLGPADGTATAALNPAQQALWQACIGDPAAVKPARASPCASPGGPGWFYLGRAVSDRQGRVLGLVMAGVSPGGFAERARRWQDPTGAGVTVTLRTRDSLVLASWSTADAPVQPGADHPSAPGEPAGLSTGLTPPWLLMRAGLENQPYVVTAAVTQAAGLKPWTAQLAWIVGTGLLSLGLLGGCLSLHQRQARHLAVQVQERRTAEASLQALQADVALRIDEGTARLTREVQHQSRGRQALARANEQVASLAHQAGRAEVANSVLHNVGNVLNSINVSAAVLTEQVQRTALRDLPRAVELVAPMLESASAPRAGEGPSGAEAAHFLRLLADQWHTEQTLLLNETAQLSERVRHIRAIVERQQLLSGESGLSTRFNLPSVVQDALTAHQDALQRDGVDVVQTRMDDAPWRGDRNKLTQIVLNLLINAQEAACRGPGRPPRIALQGEISPEGGLSIAVTDNGMGFDAQARAHLFTFGYTTKPGGHGMGLHLSAIAAMEMGGHLGAASDGPGLGATFTLNLPPAPAGGPA